MLRRSSLKRYKLRINAKINIGLSVLGQREDSYHLLDMTMLPISYYDYLRIEVEDREGSLRIYSQDRTVPRDERNILYKVYQAFYKNLGQKSLKMKLSLKKKIPSQAGLGGGSADGAFFLSWLNVYHGYVFSQERLEEIALSIGADLPFFLRNRACRVQGIGEQLREFPLQLSHKLLVIKPEFGFSTPEVYRLCDSLTEKREISISRLIQLLQREEYECLEQEIGNHLEDAILLHHPECKAWKEKVEQKIKRKIFLTGSGSAFYLFIHPNVAQQIRKVCQKKIKNSQIKLCSFL